MPSLNLDVLDTICVFLTDYPDLLSLSLTSSVLRPIAIRNILRNQPVILKNVDIIRKFHDFVFSDAAARAHHIVALRIDVAHDETHPEGSERAIDYLLAILKRAPSLMSLELHSHANGRPLGYLDDPKLAAAVAELASLRALTIYGRTKTVDFIAAVRSPLKTLAIHFVDPVVGGTGTEWSPATLSAALSVIANSLENLTMIYSPVRLVPVGVLADSLPPFTGTQFHALRSLTLRLSLTGVLHLPLLLDLFPNLNGTLHLPGYPDAADGTDDWTPYDSFKMTRERNTRAQEQRTWKRLEQLICEPETLFMLNLRSEIGLTTVNSCSMELGSDRKRYLVESFREHPPTRLNLHIQLSLWDEPRAPLVGIIPPEAAAVLSHLTLCVTYRYEAPSGRPAVPWVDIWRDTLLPALLDLPSLTHLRFVFYCDAWMDPADSELDGGSMISEDAFLNDVRPASFAFAAVARSVVGAMPSLRYCFLTTTGRAAEMKTVAVFSVAERWRESRAWRIATDGGADSGAGRNRGFVELHDDVAEAIMAKEGLVLSTEEQEAMHWL